MSPTRSMLFAVTALFAGVGCSPGAARVADDLPVLMARDTPAIASPQALAGGRLHVDAAGCLRVGEGGPFVIWPYGSRISRNPDGAVQVTDGASGNVVQVGAEFAVAGAGVDTPPTGLTQPVPAACATGGYWLAGPVMSEAQRRAAAERQAAIRPAG